MKVGSGRGGYRIRNIKRHNRCPLRFFFKAPHQTTEYLNLIDRFGGNKKISGDPID